MKTLAKLTCLLAASAFVSAPLHAQSDATDPVGVVTFEVNPNSDQRLGIPLNRPNSFKGVASSVNGTEVSANELETLEGAHYLHVTSGSAQGTWESVLSSSAGKLVIERSIEGFVAGDSFAVKPFWTLGDLFPDGGGIPKSSNVFSPVAFLILSEPSAVGVNISGGKALFYHDGSQGDEGWYDIDDRGAGVIDDLVVSPETFLTIRNLTSDLAMVKVVGSVPTEKFAVDLVSRGEGQQDNQVFNPFPVEVNLSQLGLIESQAFSKSPNVFKPIDSVLVYRMGNVGKNPSADKLYFYHDGSQGPEGWYDKDDLGAGVQENIILPGGASFIVRKGAGSDANLPWSPDLPYLLD